MEIAKMFASLGFKIDMAALSSFDAGIRKSKGELANFSRGVNEAARKTNVLIRRLEALNSGFDTSKVTVATKNIKANAKAYRTAVQDTTNTIGKFETKLESLMLTLKRTDNHLLNGMSNMLAYSSSVLHARTSVEALVLQIRALRALGGGSASVNLNQNAHGGNRTGSGAPSSIASTASSGFAAGAAGGMLQRFLRPTLGAGMVAGGALTAGYALKEVVDVGREYQRMVTKIQAVSRSTEEFNQNMEYLKKTSNELGTSTVDFGNAYAGIFEVTKKSQGMGKTQEAYTGFNQFFKVMQMTPDESKGALRAIQQMFNKGKVMAEEFTGQLGERAIGVTNLMAQTLGITTDVLFKQMQEGKLKPEDMFKLAKAMSEFATSSAGYEQALKNSTSAQARMKNAWQLFAYTVLESGLDEALVAVFVGLSEIVRIATPVIKYLISAAKTFVMIAKGAIAAAKAVVWMAAEFKVFTAVVLALFLRQWIFTAISMAASWLTATVLVMEQTAAVALAIQRLQAIMKGFVAVFMLTAMIEVWRQVDLYMKGEDNWIAVFIGYAMIAIGHIDVMAAKFEYLWALIKNAPRLSLQTINDGLNQVFGATNPSLVRDLKSIPTESYMNAGTPTQVEAFRRWENLPSTSIWDVMTRSGGFNPQEMQSLGMGSGNTLNVVISTPDGRTFTQPIDLRSGTPVTVNLGGAANR